MTKKEENQQTQKKKSNNTVIILTGVLFSILILCLVGFIHYAFYSISNEAVLKEKALENSKIFVENALHTQPENNLSEKEIFYHKSEVIQQARINSCKNLSSILSKNFVGIKDCYSINPVDKASGHGNAAIFSKVSKLKQTKYTLLANNEQKIEYDVVLEIKSVSPKATDSSSDGSLVNRDGTALINELYVITDSSGLVIKSNIQEKAKEFSVLWDGTPEILEVEWN